MIRTKNILWLISIVVLFATSCGKTTPESKPRYKVLLADVVKPSVREVFSDISLVPLQTEGVPLVAMVSKTVFYQDKVYILDEKQRAIFVFDTTGRFVLELKREGKGVGEYPLITDFEVNKFENCIDVMTCYGDVYSYSLQGEFLSSYKLPSSVVAVHYFANYSKDTVVFYVIEEGNRLFYYSKSKKEIVYEGNPYPECNAMLTIHPFYWYNGQLLMHESYVQERYVITPNGLSINSYVDFGPHNFNKDEVESYGSEKLLYDVVSGKFSKMVNSWQNESISHFICFSYYKKKFYHAIFYKHSNTSVVFHEFTENAKFPSQTTFIGRDLYVVLSAQYLKQYVNEKIAQEYKLADLDKINLYSNPVLIKYKLKSDL
jgi:hypothetical protein